MKFLTFIAVLGAINSADALRVFYNDDVVEKQHRQAVDGLVASAHAANAATKQAQEAFKASQAAADAQQEAAIAQGHRDYAKWRLGNIKKQEAGQA